MNSTKKKLLISAILALQLILTLNSNAYPIISTDQNIYTNQNNNINFQYICDSTKDTSDYHTGDIIQYYITNCNNYECKIIKTGNFIWKTNCNIKKTIETYTPQVKKTTFIYTAKKQYDNQYTENTITEFETINLTETTTNNQVSTTKTINEQTPINYIIIIGIILLIIGTLILLFKKWYGIIPLLIGIITIIITLFR